MKKPNLSKLRSPNANSPRAVTVKVAATVPSSRSSVDLDPTVKVKPSLPNEIDLLHVAYDRVRNSLELLENKLHLITIQSDCNTVSEFERPDSPSSSQLRDSLSSAVYKFNVMAERIDLITDSLDL